MNQAKTAPAVSHAEIALKRLRHLCQGGNHLFVPVQRAATTLGQARAQNASPKFKVKPDYRTLVADTMGAPTFNDIVPLAEHEYDEKISASSLAERRGQQAGRLAILLAKTAAAHDSSIPDLTSYALNVINEWQPTAREPEVKVNLANEMHEDVLQHFATADIRMEFAVNSLQDPQPEDIENACTVLRVLNPNKLIARQERIRQLMMENMGIVAVRMANSGEEAKRTYALQIFETLYKQGKGHAGVHVARMRFEGWGTEKKGRDIGKANSDIDKVFADFTQSNRALFQSRQGLEEMLALRIRIKERLIVNGKDNPQVVFRRAKELIDTLLECLRNDFKGYGVELAMLLVPHNPRPNELRNIIDGHDELKSYCLQMHHNLCAQIRANGMELPEPPESEHA